MVRFTGLLLALSTAGSLVAASSAQAREARLRRQDCSGSVGQYTEQCTLYGLNCECAQNGTEPCSMNGGPEEGATCGSGTGTGAGGGGSFPTDPGAGSCPDCGTGHAGGSNNVGLGDGTGDGSSSEE